LFDGKEHLRRVPVAIIMGQLTLDRENYEKQFEIGNSVYIALAKQSSTRLFVGLNRVHPDAEHADFYWGLAWHEDGTDKENFWVDKAPKEEMHKYALELVKNFQAKTFDIVRATKVEEILAPPIIIRDIDLEGNMPNRRVTLLGDSAHAMAPSKLAACF
jgi:hypothetical protein